MSTKTIDVRALRDLAEANLDLDYVESEGPDVIRFDKGGRSVWVYESGSFDGDPMMIRLLKKVASKM